MIQKLNIQQFTSEIYLSYFNIINNIICAIVLYKFMNIVIRNEKFD